MLFVLSLYAGVVYAVFFRFKLLPWNGTSKSISGFVGVIIALTVLGALSYLTPTGRVSVQGATIEITPEVAGTVVDVAAEANQPVKQGDLLFRIDPTRFEMDVLRLEAVLVDAKASEAVLHAEIDSAQAEVRRLEAQLTFGFQRREDIAELTVRGVSNQFQMQDAESNIEQLRAALDGARARQAGVEARISASINDVNTAVVQAQQALAMAEWQLSQTEVRAPADGMVAALTLKPGQRVTTVQPSMVFLPDDTFTLVGVFDQNGAHAFEVGSEVMVAMQALPGTWFPAVVDAIIPGTGEGSLGGATGTLPNIRQLRGSNQFAVRLSMPDDLPAHATRLGMAGHALRVADGAGPVEPLAKALFWIATQLNYI